MGIIPNSKWGVCSQCGSEGNAVKHKRDLLCLNCNDNRKALESIERAKAKTATRGTQSKLRSISDRHSAEIMKAKNAIINDLDFVCSRIVRLMASDENGICTCYICGYQDRWQDMDCGHFVKRGNLSTRFDITYNLRANCKRCNQVKDGNLIKYAEELKKEFGDGIIEQLQERGREVWQPSNAELSELLIANKNRLKILMGKIKPAKDN